MHPSLTNRLRYPAAKEFKRSVVEMIKQIVNPSFNISLGVITLSFLIGASILPAPTQTAGARELEIVPGKVIPSVPCKGKPEQSYALYLPSNYSASKPWPLIAAFDPGARGQMAVDAFKEAAER